ncbi:MAG TPA: exopolyphosphatase, partial [Acidimicrobiales bacterium]|nr:exopolyphosphatase [Acidimicrobiales bacterium]
KVGRAFADAATELALAGYTGFHLTSPPTDATAYGVFWPALVPAELVEAVVVAADGTRTAVPHQAFRLGMAASGPLPELQPAAPFPAEPVARVPLGTIVGARSGDKGGNANVGLWVGRASHYGWLRDYLTVERMAELLPEADGLEIRRYELPRVLALNFVVVGLLGEGVASSTRPDPQAKSLGEYLRSRLVDIPVSFLPDGR